MKSLLILGRQPKLGLAELESLFGADHVNSIGIGAAAIDIEPKDIPIRRLGGSVKLAKILTELPYTDFSKLIDYVDKTLPDHLHYIPEGKIKFGISVYDIRADVGSINRATLRIKKTIKAAGRSVRVIPNNQLTLNSAQVLHNQLTSALGMELIFVRYDDKTILAQTAAEQDIDAYAARDQGRPKRDARVGMLPPKLAQIITNLAVGRIKNQESRIKILDPFCGTGVVLQEALLMGYEALGSDLEPRMVEYTTQNLNWLIPKFQIPNAKFEVNSGDATNYQWGASTLSPLPSSLFIACETYLGRAFSSQPESKVLQEVMQDVNLIHKRFLQNVARQTEPGFRMCIAIPAWKTNEGFKHLKTLETLPKLGYNRIEFVHADAEDLIYHREGQIVARELVVLTRA